ncbi:hypothetical protein [Lactiplantibacillus brownii]|uniref:hypothetical protein n=1 Tax=Lactiplantibacillus brownii TaxID=3069269 RepID=UPI0038B24F02
MNQLQVHNQVDALKNPIAAFNDLRHSTKLKGLWENRHNQIISDEQLSFDQTIDAANGLLRDAGFKENDPQSLNKPWLSEK